jgi:hypothetical protein
MKILVFLSLMFYSGNCISQRVINVDDPPARLPNSAFYITGGHTVSTTKYIRVISGSPYFSETWMKGTVYLTDSTVARNVRVRLDLFDGSLLYINENNEEMISVLPVYQVSILDTVTNKKYIFIHSSTIAGESKNKKTWYEVLAGEKFTLLKEYHKEVLETKAYASSVTEQEIRTSERYFIGVNNTISRVKTLPDIVALAGDRAGQLQQYISENKLSPKKETDLISLVRYCHTLSK